MLTHIYGTLDAAAGYQTGLNEVLIDKLDFEVSQACMTSLMQQTTDIKMIVYYGDDIAADTFETAGDKFLDCLDAYFEMMSSKAKLGLLKHHDKEGRLLNRLLTWTEEGLQVEGDPRHVELTIWTLESQCRCPRPRSASTPSHSQRS